MSRAPVEVCATCGEVSTCTVREICPDCNAPFSPEANICKKAPAECLACKKCEREEN
jgi:hypothetical protein